MNVHWPNDSKEQAREILRRFGVLRGTRSAFESVWEDVACHMGPYFRGFTESVVHPLEQDPGIVDGTARRAAGVFSAGMLSGASNPAQRWFSLTLEDKERAEHPETRGWLQEVEDAYYRDLLRLGYYQCQHLNYHHAGLFGWQCLYVDELPTSGIRFRALRLPEVFIAENFQGEVDTVHRRFTLTARQAVQKWGKGAVSARIRDAYAKKRENEEFVFVHAVFPAQDRNSPRLDRNNLAYASFYVEEQARHVVSEGGYAEMPYVVTRSHRLPGTPYSYSPGTEALADVQMVNEMKRLILEAGQLAVAPPYLVPDDGFVGQFTYKPWSMNYYRKDEQFALQDFGPLQVGSDPRFSMELLQATRQDIDEAFFVSLFQAMKQRIEQGSTPSATEVAELAGEKMFLLGPMILQQQQENFEKLFDRLYSLKLRRGELPPMPRELEGQNMRAEYISPLVLAQREAQTQSILQTYAESRVIAEVDPQVLDILNHDENFRRVLAQRGIPQKGVRGEGEVEDIRQARARQQAQQQQVQGLMELADKLPQLSKAPEAGSPAEAVAQAAGGGGA